MRRITLLLGASACVVLFSTLPAGGETQRAAPEPRLTVHQVHVELGWTADAVLYSVDAIGGHTAWAVGKAYPVRGSDGTRAYIQGWQGGRWTPTATPYIGSASLADVDVVSARSAWAVGRYRPPGPDAQYASLIYRWDGHEWEQQGAATRVPLSVLYSVSGRSPTDVWAAGSRYLPGRHQSLPLILHWNGVRWSHVRPPPQWRFSNATFIDVQVMPSDEVWFTSSSGVAVLRRDMWTVDEEHAYLLGAAHGHLWGAAWGVLAFRQGARWLQAAEVPFRNYCAPGKGPDPEVSGHDVWLAGTDCGNNGHREKGVLLQWDGASWTRATLARSDRAVGFSDSARGTGDNRWVVGYSYDQDEFWPLRPLIARVVD